MEFSNEFENGLASGLSSGFGTDTDSDSDNWLLPEGYDNDDKPLYSPSALFSNDEFSLDDDPADLLKIDPCIREFNSAYFPKHGKRLF